MPIQPPVQPQRPQRARPALRRIVRVGAALALAPILLAVFVVAGEAQLTQRTVAELGPADLLKSTRQRELVDELARRHLGTQLRGDLRDLDTLQRLLDDRHVDDVDVFSQQALGVVLGDVMVGQLRLHWVVVDDDYGHSRALRWRESEVLFFPVTMISKRVQAGDRVSVRGLYGKVEDEVRKLRRRS